MSKRKNNYRSVHNIITVIELNGAYTQGSSTIRLADNDRRHGIQFKDRKAYDVYATDGLLDQLKHDPAIKSIGAIKEIRYRNLDEHKGAL